MKNSPVSSPRSDHCASSPASVSRTSQRVRVMARSASARSSVAQKSGAALRRAVDSAAGGREIGVAAPATSSSSSSAVRSAGVLDVVQLAAQALGGCEDVVERRTVLLLQTLEGGEPIFDLLQARRRGVDVGGVGAQEERQVLELRLHGLARFEVRREPRVQRGEIADLAPDDAERRERRLVPFVERGVGVVAEPLQLVGVGEDLSRAAASSSSSPGCGATRSISASWNGGTPRAPPSRARRSAVGRVRRERAARRRMRLATCRACAR